jgi:hypothetical protein
VILYFIVRSRTFSDEELTREEENQAYLQLNSHEQELYFQSRDYLADNPYYRGELQLSQSLLIQEKAINAYEFVKDAMLTNQDLVIINKTELNFFKNFECSTTTNLPMPMQNDVYYFECKIYSFAPTDVDKDLISIGLGIKPYPWFRLPGRHQHSVSYDSNGYRRYNQPFPITSEPPFPQFIEGDVIGIGYRVRSGTIFFTRNGKKVSESKIGGHIKNFKISEAGQLYPIIGANTLCSVHVNLGQAGFVFIEGNVKKWGFAPLEGTGPAPPAYNKFNGDILLERSEIDDENDLSERENDFPPDFWEVHGNEEIFNKNEVNNDANITNNDKFSYNAYSDVDTDEERITLNSLIPSNMPPSYSDDGGEPNEEVQQEVNEEAHEEVEEGTVDGGTVVDNQSGPEQPEDQSAESQSTDDQLQNCTDEGTPENDGQGTSTLGLSLVEDEIGNNVEQNKVHDPPADTELQGANVETTEDDEEPVQS